MKRTILLCFAVFTLPAAARAEGAGTGSVGISATVPEICQIDASSLVLGEGDVAVSGAVSEMCNSGRAFRVMASHRSLQPGESVEITYAGEVTRLDASGSSAIAHRSGPVARQVPVSVRSDGLVEALAISIGLMAI